MPASTSLLGLPFKETLKIDNHPYHDSAHLFYNSNKDHIGPKDLREISKHFVHFREARRVTKDYAFVTAKHIDEVEILYKQVPYTSSRLLTHCIISEKKTPKKKSILYVMFVFKSL